MDRRNRRTHAGADDGVWTSRPLLAFAVRAVVVLVPIALGTLTARWVAGQFPATASLWLVGAVSLLAAVIISAGTAQVAIRALPLAALLKMTMIFPDQAPSRLRVARRASTRAELARRLQDPDTDTREAASTLLALATALSRHDRITRGHSERVRLFCDLLGKELGLSDADRGRLRWAGLLHDIGKLRVAAAILNKPGELDEYERRIIEDHPEHGARIARPLAAWLGPWFDGIAQHHEHFDGTGYPRGLAGEQISLAGRAVSVLDAFDVMTSARSYKSPVPTAAARAELTRCAGSQFDPAMVRAFLSIALPRLLWTMGPLTFLVNVPFLRWIPAASVRTADAASAGLAGASGAVQAGAVAAALVSAPVSAVAHAAADTHATSTSATARQVAAPTAYGHPADVAASAGGAVAASTSAAAPTPSLPGRSRSGLTPAGQAEKSDKPTPTTPPGQPKKSGKPTTPPGQVKKSGKPTTPPGQVKKSGKPTTPPGQVKKSSKPRRRPRPGRSRRAAKPTRRPGRARSPDQAPHDHRSTPSAA